jgi:hypothetical protein
MVRLMQRHPDGSLEMHWMNQQVDPEHRGQNLSNQTMQAENRMLKALTDHPENCFTLRAGNAKENAVGTYVWAKAGFSFDRPGDLSAMREGFSAWLSKQDLTTSEREQLEKQSQSWTEPSEFATADHQGKRFPAMFQSEPIEAPLGKAFLLSIDAKPYRGKLNASQVGTQKPIGPEPGFDPTPGIELEVADPGRPMHERLMALGCLDDQNLQRTSELFRDLGPTDEIVQHFQRHQSDDPFWLPKAASELSVIGPAAQKKGVSLDQLSREVQSWGPLPLHELNQRLNAPAPHLPG